MKMVIFVLFASIVWAFTSTWQADDHNTTEAADRLKYALDIATHDASLQIDPLQRDKGYIRFAANTQTVFNQSLQRTLKLDGTLHPTGTNNIFKSSDQVQVLVFEKVETGCPGKPAGFPCVYTNSTYGYTDTIYGPSIIAIISMKGPKPFGTSQDLTFMVGSSHEFKSY